MRFGESLFGQGLVSTEDLDAELSVGKEGGRLGQVRAVGLIIVGRR